MKATNLELHIEQLVLHGFPPGDRYRISAAVEAELTRLFTEQGVPPSLAKYADSAQVNAGTFNILPGSKAETIGTQVAEALYGGLRR
jgi:hypothetical protein